ncbi:MAG: redoxin domain-containing protein [Planctomycetes bacterium]|jgi:thiol-disulfide isomerase/thioredoxin|nr:redoxin domain-containing protein [Planctomycetota bacterium]
MKAWILSAAVVGALSIVPLVAQDSTKPAQDKPADTAQAEKKPYKVGDVVDETIKLTDIDGKSVTMKELRGKVVFIHFWSKNCPYEVVADPKVAKLEKEWKDKNVVTLAINSNSTEIGTTPPSDNAFYDPIRKHLKEKEIAMRVFADHGNKVADMFNAQSTPHCFVIDPKGKLVYAGGLDDDPKGEKGDATAQYVRDAVEATLAGKEVKVATSKHYGCSIKRVKVGA